MNPLTNLTEDTPSLASFQIRIVFNVDLYETFNTSHMTNVMLLQCPSLFLHRKGRVGRWGVVFLVSRQKNSSEFYPESTSPTYKIHLKCYLGVYPSQIQPRVFLYLLLFKIKSTLFFRLDTQHGTGQTNTK